MASKFRTLCQLMVDYYTDMAQKAKDFGDTKVIQLAKGELLDWTELLGRAPEA